ncbi:inositol polyphosphate phosphatase [Guyanagaster necrorhizus]|uniref:Inositol polyphosphate phosphatase n=1 Tax=Guyanagaster necrorhizus TaxID=856835 RepID=A0A9P7VWN7_9AGAR|nr:inositol polyphosphate phosphatase [Guyanagaster necrorhizus MCA 3950]KAG7447983.1 inositol polyphosphate phosphatase [Guyanagaster necrorhizus MCA 3950]
MHPTGLPHDGVLVQIATYNTNLQGSLGLPQDLVDWLSPTLQVSTFLSRSLRAPDIIAVGFQELLPLHLGLSGFSKSVIDHRNAHILAQLEAHAPNKERYALIAKVVNVGVALLVYGKDEGIAKTVCDVQTSWTGCGPLYMGNKGAVGVRFRAPGENGSVGEVYTFVCAHLTAHTERLAQRVDDYNHIVSTLLFPSPSSPSTTIYSTSHLFIFGDLNFRLSIPPCHPLHAFHTEPDVAAVLAAPETRETLKEFDQLLTERRKGTTLVGLREGEFWKFKCSYKYDLGEVDKYSEKRVPSWTDRILYTTYTDSPETPNNSYITNLLYTSVPGYTTSDHKPVVSLLFIPPRAPVTSPTPPTLRLRSYYSPTPDPLATYKRYTGRVFDRVIGIIWWIFTLFGAGSAIVGIFNFFFGIGAWSWWRSTPSNSSV